MRQFRTLSIRALGVAAAAGEHAVYWVYSRFPDHGFSQAPVKITGSGATGREAIDPTTYAGAARQLAQVAGNAPVMEAPSMLYRNDRLWLFVALASA